MKILDGEQNETAGEVDGQKRKDTLKEIMYEADGRTKMKSKWSDICLGLNSSLSAKRGKTLVKVLHYSINIQEAFQLKFDRIIFISHINI